MSERYRLFPIKNDVYWKLSKQLLSSFWTAEEATASIDKDKRDFDEKLSPDERHFIISILEFFRTADAIFMDYINNNYMDLIDIPEALAFFAHQGSNEAVHNETYSLLIDGLISNPQHKDEIFSRVNDSPVTKEKIDWMISWTNSNEMGRIQAARREQEHLIMFERGRDSVEGDLKKLITKWNEEDLHRVKTYEEEDKENKKHLIAKLLLVGVITEGIFFSGAFCAIFWFKNRSLLLHAVGKSNEWIARDEGLHATMAVELYNREVRGKYRLSQDAVYEMFSDAVRVEKIFIEKSLPNKLIEMSADSMKQYVESVADFWLSELGYDPLFGSVNPFDFMELLSLSGKTNIFEHQVSEYSKFGSGKSKGGGFSIDEDF